MEAPWKSVPSRGSLTSGSWLLVKSYSDNLSGHQGDFDPARKSHEPRAKSKKLFSVCFRNVVPIPCRDLYHNFARFVDHSLTSQARVQLQVGRHIELVGLVVFHLGDQVRAFLNPDVTRRAGTISATGV